MLRSIRSLFERVAWRLRAPHPWDVAASQLLSLKPQIWPGPHRNMTAQQHAADFFGMRALRRVVALDALFRRGLYVEAHIVVRAGYEDWITFAYILRGGEGRWTEFKTDVNKIDARVHDGFEKLCGEAAADRYFPNLPPGVTRHVGRPRSKTATMGGVTMARRAKEVGLSLVHGYVYEWLSAYAVPTSRSYPMLFERTDIGIKVRRLRRDNEQEGTLGLWAWWFELRILTLAAAQYGIDIESLSEELLAHKNNDLYSCVLVREDVERSGGSQFISAREVPLPRELRYEVDWHGERGSGQTSRRSGAKVSRDGKASAVNLTHDGCPQPADPNCLLWRYGTITRFEDLVQNQALYFARASRFEDSFEGSITRAISEWRAGFMSNECIEEAEFVTDLIRQWTYVNCWHRSEHESIAMWERYGKGG